ncbi:Crp/Fnr family transcriptional regulator [Actinopolymorpha sp. B11F2]|uniref:Crp/Fnr family transcriptional regulator n=1 Tax=Actinopolymorpha sp. B11F2 TaxID=3160862 RepID=UPI0032E4668E
MRDQIGALATVPLFSMLGDQRLRRLAAHSAVRTIASGTVAATRGEPASHLLVVESGALTAFHDSTQGRRVNLGDFHAPCAVDKAAVLDRGGHTATWQASGTTRLRRFPRDEVLALVDDVPAVRRHVLAHLAAQVRHHQTERIRATLDDATTRAAIWLVQATATHGRRIPLPQGQQGLGEAIGATRVTTNRALRHLARDELIRIEPGAVIVLAPELLAHRAASSSR